jgi:pyruvate dehydrogenase E1 component beta subunit
MADLKYAEAVRAALRDEMRADSGVVLFGEEIGKLGGVFTVTQGLQAEFGEDRVLDAPISEAAMIGWAVGAATEGLKPVVEIMFMDFVTVAMDQIVNAASKLAFMSGYQYQVPLVVRMPYGGGTYHGPQHSQSLETWFAHVPGLAVYCPSTSSDAYWLLRLAIQNPEPVIFLESKALYFNESGPISERPDDRQALKCRLVRKGSHVTVVTSGRMVSRCEAAAATLSSSGIECEILDVRSLWPLDMETIAESVERTGKLAIVHEAVEFCGWGSEVAAWIAQNRMFHLDGPVTRIGSARSPIGFSKVLEDATIPTVERIEATISDLAAF